MKCGYTKCRRDFTSGAFRPQRYCSIRCKVLAKNARRRWRYRRDEALRKRAQERMRTYRRWCSATAPA